MRKISLNTAKQMDVPRSIKKKEYQRKKLLKQRRINQTDELRTRIKSLNPPKDRKERAMREGERGESTKGKGGLYNMPQYSTLPQKCPRSGVTFHLQFILNAPIIMLSKCKGTKPLIE